MKEQLKNTGKELGQEPQLAGEDPAKVVQETYDINAKMLGEKMDPATRPSTIYEVYIDGTRCMAYTVNLYVDVSTGRITDIKTVEDEQREAQKKNGHYLDDGKGFLAPVVTLDGVTTEPPEGTVKVPVMYAKTFPLSGARYSDDKIYVDRPRPWVRNDQIILDMQREGVELDALITDPIERGILLKSIDDHNITAEPAVVKNA